MNRGILNLDAQVIFFPVRHHSPLCAAKVRELILQVQPAAVLIEGPTDFNSRFAELSLPHRLPIAIYSYVRLPDGMRRGAFYPFCIYSPEWQAIQAARKVGATTRFIDLPWLDIAALEVLSPNKSRTPSHRYADGELRRSDYISLLCRKLGVENFDALWDTLFEIETAMPLPEFMERCHAFCLHARLADWQVPAEDIFREAYMTEQIRNTLQEKGGRIIVVTGGFHSYALYSRLHNLPFESAAVDNGAGSTLEDGVREQDGAEAPEISTVLSEYERGIALTPYSYFRLDSLTGYESGMPNPGFYARVWHDHEVGASNTYRQVLSEAVKALRQRKQIASSADLIAVETTARALAALRGHKAVWRTDLVDGIVGALVKEELDTGLSHPFLEAIYEAMRGHERGQLAAGAALPPLVHDLRATIARLDLEPLSHDAGESATGSRLRRGEEAPRTIELELEKAEDLERSRVLHRLRMLDIAGYARTGGSDLSQRDDLTRLWEQWSVRWQPEFDATCIEAAIYGATLEEAAGAKLLETAKEAERDAERAALLLLDAALMGLRYTTEEFHQRLIGLIRADGDFFRISRALEHLLYLYRYDEILGTAGHAEIGVALTEASYRCLWLLEALGQPQGRDKELIRGVKSLLSTFEAAGATLELDREEFVEAIERAGADTSQSPLMRGAALGILWTLGEAHTERILPVLRDCALPDRLGDFLAGLFALAREAAQRHPELVASIDELLRGYGDEAFVEALPALRLAFSYFTPREKHYMARTLIQQQGDAPAPLADLEVSVEAAAHVLAFEARLFRTVERYGLRGGQSDEAQEKG